NRQSSIPRSVKLLQREARCILFRLLLARPIPRGDRLARDDDLHVKHFVMIGADGANQPIIRQRTIARLEIFLQLGFVVASGEAAPPSLGDERREPARDEGPRLVDPPVQINRRNQRFVAIREQRLLSPAAGLFLATPEQEMFAEAQALRLPAEGGRRDE